jgi:flagellar biosynthesis anti-sigma factor FlgM
MANTITQVPSGLLNVQPDPAIATGGPRPVSTDASTSVTSTTSPVDRTTLSPLAQLLHSVAQTAITLSSFRADLVAHLRATIAAGTYQADASQVAQRVAQALSNSAGGGSSGPPSGSNS